MRSARRLYVSRSIVDMYRFQCFLPPISQPYAKLPPAISRCDHWPSPGVKQTGGAMGR
jgi:hypothetical protein